MIEEASKIEMPPRSRLYSLPMRGECGATYESMFDYAQRLAAAHHLSGRRMFTSIYLPEAGRSHLVSGNTVLNPKVVASLNGTSKLAEDFVAGMERLTGRADLNRGTLLAWRGILGNRVSFASSRRWCPCCLSMQKAHHHFSFSLLWSLNGVVACPIHKVPLATVCGHCGKPQQRLHKLAPYGVCTNCRRYLSDEVHVQGSTDERDLYFATSAASMLEIGEEAPALATIENFKGRLRWTVDAHFGGSVHRFARELGVRREVLSYQGGIALLRLLDLTYRLGTTPVDLLKQPSEPRALSSRLTPRSVRYVRRVALREADLKKELILLLADGDKWRVPLPVQSLRRRLGLTSATLDKHFPAEMTKVRQYNEQARTRRATDRKAAKVAAIAQAMRAIVEVGAPTSRRSISRALKRSGVGWHTQEVMAAARTELANVSASEAI